MKKSKILTAVLLTVLFSMHANAYTFQETCPSLQNVRSNSDHLHKWNGVQNAALPDVHFTLSQTDAFPSPQTNVQILSCIYDDANAGLTFEKRKMVSSVFCQPTSGLLGSFDCF